MKKVLTLLSFVLLTALTTSVAGTIPPGGEPLSLGLLSFSGYNRGAVVNLDWEAMSWSTSSVFGIERSADGITWNTIQEVSAKQTNETSAHYSATDKNPIVGDGFYRIVFSNDVGERAVSNPLRIYTAASAAGEVFLYPNPCVDAVSLNGLAAGSRIVIRNAAGCEVFNGNSAERQSISTGEWRPGVYFVRIATPEGQIIQSKLVRR